MPVDIEPRHPPAALGRRSRRRQPGDGTPIVVGLVNNMPDAALESTEAQFRGLLQAAAGARAVSLRLSSLAELPRSPEARERIARGYWPIAQLLAEPPDALIVTGTEPRTPHLREEPYWRSFVELLTWAQRHTVASVWSCLAAHATVEELDGIERRRLPEKRCGLYAHSILSGHPLLRGVSAPLMMPHSRWNDLPVPALREAGYTLLSWSQETGADAFVRDRESLMVFFQGHPEYEDTTLLKEYRRDVGRFLAGTQPAYPTLPQGYFSPEASAALSAFRARAIGDRRPELIESFPFAAAAAALVNTWRSAAVAIYRNWLAHVASAHRPLQLADTVPPQ